MADIRPFHGVHYNPSLIKDMAQVICPPYDIISTQMQQELHQRSEYNFVRIEHGYEYPHDSNTENKYTRAAGAFEEWLERKILVRDATLALYVNEHAFAYQGKTLRRHSINAIVKLEDWSKMIIRPHEGTLAKAKSDRLNMLWALHANTSPIMALYDDNKGSIATLIARQTKKKPLLTVNKADGENHRFWAVTDEDTILKIHNALADQPLYIADGHHRYESALNYKRERRSTSATGSKEEPFDFVMMTLISMADPGLVILPAHRMVNGLSAKALDDLLERLPAFFKIDEASIDKIKIQAQVSSLLEGNEGKTKLVLCGLKKDVFLTLELQNPDAVKQMFPAFHSELYQTLDVSIVDHVILEELLGISQEKSSFYLNWVHDAVTAVQKVLNGEYQLGIIVNPVKPGLITAIADSGDRMPKKSTYFFPKAPAGLVSYRF